MLKASGLGGFRVVWFDSSPQFEGAGTELIFVFSVQQLKRRTITSALKVPGVPEMIVERPEIAASPTFCAKPVEVVSQKMEAKLEIKVLYSVLPALLL